MVLLILLFTILTAFNKMSYKHNWIRSVVISLLQFGLVYTIRTIYVYMIGILGYAIILCVLISIVWNFRKSLLHFIQCFQISLDLWFRAFILGFLNILGRLIGLDELTLLETQLICLRMFPPMAVCLDNKAALSGGSRGPFMSYLTGLFSSQHRGYGNLIKFEPASKWTGNQTALVEACARGSTSEILFLCSKSMGDSDGLDVREVIKLTHLRHNNYKSGNVLFKAQCEQNILECVSACKTYYIREFAEVEGLIPSILSFYQNNGNMLKLHPNRVRILEAILPKIQWSGMLTAENKLCSDIICWISGGPKRFDFLKLLNESGQFLDVGYRTKGLLNVWKPKEFLGDAGVLSDDMKDLFISEFKTFYMSGNASPSLSMLYQQMGWSSLKIELFEHYAPAILSDNRFWTVNCFNEVWSNIQRSLNLRGFEMTRELFVVFNNSSDIPIVNSEVPICGSTNQTFSIRVIPSSELMIDNKEELLKPSRQMTVEKYELFRRSQERIVFKAMETRFKLLSNENRNLYFKK